MTLLEMRGGDQLADLERRSFAIRDLILQEEPFLANRYPNRSRRHSASGKVEAVIALTSSPGAHDAQSGRAEIRGRALSPRQAGRRARLRIPPRASVAPASARG